MGDDAIYVDGSPELFDAASDFLLDKSMKSRKVKDQQIYNLAIKALDYYREYLAQNQPFDHTTGTYTSSSPVYKSKVDDIVDCYGNLAGSVTEVSRDPSKGTVLTIPAANILRMDAKYSSSGDVVRTVEYMDRWDSWAKVNGND